METYSWPVSLVLLYLLIHLLWVVLARHRPPDAGRLVVADLLLSILFFGILLSCRGELGWVGRTARLWAPLIFFWWAYTWAGRVLHVFHPASTSWDPGLIRLERGLGQPSLWMAWNRGRWLTELMHFFYATYYLYTPLLGIWLHLSGRPGDFERMSFAVLFGYAVSYPLFSVLPVWGPRWGHLASGALKQSDQILQGYSITAAMNRVMYGGPALKGGAMPSSHSSTALVFLVWCWRIWGIEGGLPALVVVLGMWVGAVYGRYHYVVDLLVGILLGCVGVWLADRLVTGA